MSYRSDSIRRHPAAIRERESVRRKVRELKRRYPNSFGLESISQWLKARDRRRIPKTWGNP